MKDFSEKMYEAITDIDDTFITEAENAGKTSHLTVVKRRRKYLAVAACFVILVIAAFPLMSQINRYDGSKDLAGMESQENYAPNDVPKDVPKDEEDSVDMSADGNPPQAGAQSLYINSYDGDVLDDEAKDPQGVLSLMKKTALSSGDVYIVLVRNEYYVAYDANTFEIVSKHTADDYDELLLDLDIAG